MRIASYRGADGTARAAAVVNRGGSDVIVDLADASGGRLPSDVLALIERGAGAIADAGRVAAAATTGTPIGSVTLLAPMGRPPKLLAVAGNFQKHIMEGGGEPVDKTKIVPKLFIKPSSSIIGPGEALQLPDADVSTTVDWELELAVIIGRRAKHIPVEKALEYVAGYAVINDISSRTMNWGAADREPAPFFDWLNGKWPDGHAAWGPWITTADEVPDPTTLEMTLKVNGAVRQHGSTGDMIFNCAELIAFASRFMTMEPGDVIASGTLDGVGDASGTYLKSGDVMEGTVGHLGTLVTPVA